MHTLKRKAPSAIAVLLIASLSYGFSHILFSPVIESRQRALIEKRTEFHETTKLLSRKKESEAEWEKLKSTLPKAGTPEEVLNLWVKEILSLAQMEGIVFSKLEPEGISTGGGSSFGGKGKGEIRLLLGFQGDIRKLVRCLYALLEKDSLSRIETFLLKQEENTTAFSYEMNLERTLL